MKKIKWTKIGNLKWSEDLGEMTWDKAKEKCKEIGGRLPTRVELIDLYDNHREECKKMEDYYWSSTEYSSHYAWFVSFYYGSAYPSLKGGSFSVRCVRS